MALVRCSQTSHNTESKFFYLLR